MVKEVCVWIPGWQGVDCSGFILSQRGWKSACSLGHRRQCSQALESRSEATAISVHTQKLSTEAAGAHGLTCWAWGCCEAYSSSSTHEPLFVPPICMCDEQLSCVFIQAVDRSTVQFFGQNQIHGTVYFIGQYNTNTLV